MAYITGPMVESMKAGGQKESNMEQEFTLTQERRQQSMDFGRMERE